MSREPPTPIHPSPSSSSNAPYRPSSLRKLHESVSDPKYDGVRTSRKDLYEDSDQSGGEDENEDANRHLEDEDAAEDASEHGELSESGTEDDEELLSPADDDIDQAGSDPDSETPSRIQPSTPKHLVPAATIAAPVDAARTGRSDEMPDESQAEGDIASNLRKTHEADRKKGRAVARQIVCPYSPPRVAVLSYRCRNRHPGPLGHASRRAYTATQGRHLCQSPACGK